MKKEFDEKFRKRKNENETRLDFAIIVILYNFSYFLFTDYALLLQVGPRYIYI